MKCPLCGGTGKYETKFQNIAEHMRKLRKKGLTFRQILKVTGLKSTNTVAYYLDKAKRGETK